MNYASRIMRFVQLSIVRFVQLSIVTVVSCASASLASAQSNQEERAAEEQSAAQGGRVAEGERAAEGARDVEEERAALEEAQRQRDIARTFAANARQLVAHDMSGRELGTIGEPAIYTFVTYSPDLSKVATVRIDFQDELSDIWILDAETGEPTQLTRSGPREFVQTPVWSPDGSEVAYVALRGSRFGIYRQQADGEAEAELVYEHGGGPITLGDWSLDGQRLAFSASDLAGGQLYVMRLEGDREPVVILDSEHPANAPRFSPDGRYISFFSDETGRNEYYVMRAPPETASEAIGQTGGQRDGQQGGQQQQEGAQAIGEPERWQLTTEGAFGIGQWDVDDSKYYYLGPERRVMAIDVDTSGEFMFGRPEHVYTVPDAIPAAGGGGLVTLSRTGDQLIMALPPVRPRLQIALLDREGNEMGRIGEPDLYVQPSFSPDGSKLVALRQNYETGRVNVWVFDVETGTGTQVTDTVDINEESPIWMPDGEYVAYSYFDEDHGQIYRKRADGRGEQEFLFRYTPGAFITLMDASEDGQYLALESFGYVVTVPLTGSDPNAREGIDLLREEFEVSVPRFSPDGRFVAYTYNESGRHEVFVTGFDAAAGTADGERLQVSTDGTIGGIVARRRSRAVLRLREPRDRRRAQRRHGHGGRRYDDADIAGAGAAGTLYADAAAGRQSGTVAKREPKRRAFSVCAAGGVVHAN